MSHLTNKMNLPDSIFEAVRNDPYSKGDADISVTSLIAPPRKVALEDKHHEEITEDVSDRIWSLLGQSIHTILERASRSGIAEQRLSMECEGWKISGGMDLYLEDGTLVDYKTTSAWSVKGGAKDEWVQQLNVYAEILRQNNYSVKKLSVIAILRDWSKMEARRDPMYPASQVVVINLPLWEQDYARSFIRERVTLHRLARNTLPDCSPTDRWARPGVYALMKVGQKKAVKLYDNAADANAHASTAPNLLVVYRPGENIRCANYCNAAQFCTQYAAIIKETQPSQKEEVA